MLCRFSFRGALNINRVWLIPQNTVRPDDARKTKNISKDIFNKNHKGSLGSFYSIFMNIVEYCAMEKHLMHEN